MSKYDFITIGGAIEDMSFYTNEGIIIKNNKDILRQELIGFEYGAKIRSEKIYSNFGGGASNSSVCLSKLGFKVACLTSIGDDARGKNILENFKKNNVKNELIKVRKGEITGFAFLLIGQGGEHVAFSCEGAKKNLRITKDDLKELKKADYIYISSLSANCEPNLDSIFTLKNKIAWNPGGAQLKRGERFLGKYIRKTNVLLLNKDEAIELVASKKENKNKPKSFLNTVENLLKILKGWGPEIVVITGGKKGADAYDGKKFFHQNIAKERKSVDTTGVGDCFNSTFIAGLKIFKNDIQKAMKLGVVNAASVISEQGAQNGLLTKEFLLKRI